MRESDYFFLFIVACAPVNVATRRIQPITVCIQGTLPQYSLLANSDTGGGSGLEIVQVTKTACIHFCNSNINYAGDHFPCESFGYNEEERVCYLYGNKSHGNDSSNATVRKGIMVYEKLCLDAAQTCKIVPAFERSTASALVGFTQIVLANIASEEACLSECLRSMETRDFHCMSSMYYYDSQDCMLNFDSKVSPGVAEFFSNETESYNVDYYDNLCAIRERDAGITFNTCPDATAPTFLHYRNAWLLQVGVVHSNVTIEDCLKRCNDAKNFTCNSANYWPSNASCSLSHFDHTTSSQVGDFGPNYYQRLCVEGSRLLCQGENSVSFSGVLRAKLSPDYLILSLSGVSLEECLSLCLLDPSTQCQSVNYNGKLSLCQLNNATKMEAPVLDVNDEQSGYYENLCHLNNSVVVLETLTRSGKPDGMPASFTDQKKSNSSDMSTTIAPNSPTLEVEPICEYSDMRVRLVSTRAFTGFVFAKNRFGTCRVEVTNATETILSLQFPIFQGNESPCGVTETGVRKYSVIVVATSNNMGIPGLVTEGDQFINVTCDFSSDMSNVVTATAGSIAISNERDSPALYPDGVISIPSPLNLQLRRLHTREAKIHTAVLGEKLHLDFILYPGFNQTGMGLFVRQCNASRHLGPPPQPAELTLIDDGCPTSAAKDKIVQSAVIQTMEGFTLPFTAFRFDGSNGVKISCIIDMCEKGCNPTECILNGQQVASYGKRRKRSFGAKPTANSKKTELGNVIFTVVDKFQSTDNQNQRQINQDTGRYGDAENESRRGNVEQIMTYNSIETRRLCLKRTLFLGAFSLLAVFCFAQIVVIAAYIAQQYVTKGGRKVKKCN